MAAILTRSLPPIERNIPAPLRWAIDRCLAKDPGRPLRIHAGSLSGPAPRSRPPGGNHDVAGNGRRAGSPPLAVGPLSECWASRRRQGRVSICRVLNCRISRGIASRRSRSIRSARRLPIWSPDGKAVAYAGYVATSQPNPDICSLSRFVRADPDHFRPGQRRAGRVGPGQQTRHLSQLPSTGGSLVSFGSRRRAGELHAD